MIGRGRGEKKGPNLIIREAERLNEDRRIREDIVRLTAEIMAVVNSGGKT